MLALVVVSIVVAFPVKTRLNLFDSNPKSSLAIPQSSISRTVVDSDCKSGQSFVVMLGDAFSTVQATFFQTPELSFYESLPPPVLPIPWARLDREFQSIPNPPFQSIAHPHLPTCPDWLLQSIADAKAARRPRSWIRVWLTKMIRVVLSVSLLRLYIRFAWWVGRQGHFLAVLVVLPLAYVACMSFVVDSAYWFGMNLHALYNIL